MEKILTRKIVKKLGLNKLEVITSDMLDGYTRIGDEAFLDCSSLTSITIPNSVTSIGDSAFEGCTSLTSIILPNSVTSIGNIAFFECSSLTSITLPNSVTNIGSSAFYGCSSLTAMVVESGNTMYDSRENCNAIIETASNTLIAGCQSTTIPNSVTGIGDEAFSGCSSLTSITIQNSVTSIGFCAFLNDKKIDSIVISDKTYEIQTVIKDKCKAYKAFGGDLTCHGFQYEEGKTYEIDVEPELCKHGFHACLRLTDVFNYYHGEIGKEIVVHEVELEGVSDERQYDSKVVAKKITIGKRIL